MRPARLSARSLAFYWRTNIAVVAGVAVAVTVLSGALLVGDSVRGSLRDLVLARLGRTDHVVVSPYFFRVQLADDIRADTAFSSFSDACPVIAVQGFVTDQTSGRSATRVQVYGVDDRFWRFHGITEERGPVLRDVLLSPSLARELGVETGRTILLRVQRPSSIPIESVHGRKEELGRTLRLNVRDVLAPADLGEFSLQPQQGEVRAVFVSLRQLQQDLDRQDRANALLVSKKPGVAGGQLQELETLVRRYATLEDVDLKVRTLASQQVISLESDRGLVDETRAIAALEAARELGMRSLPVLTYLATSLTHGNRTIPYSLVTALELQTIAPDVKAAEADRPPIVLNAWAARDLGAKTGDTLTLDYYLWEDPGRLVTRSADFRVASAVPLAGAAADRDLAPVYPGITDSENLRDWDPPFPIDINRIRPIDEDYWHRYRTTPKAFVPLAVGQTLWRSRYGALTSIRIVPANGMTAADALERFVSRLRSKLDPMALGLTTRDVRADALAASRGATDFGEYFTYFSLFLVVSGLLLAALFFKLGVEQRVREVGLLRAVGYTPSAVRRLFMMEAVALSAPGCVLGALGAVGYGHLMMTGLRTWWFDAVGTTALTLHVTVAPLVVGAVGGMIAAVTCIWWTLRTLGRLSERDLLSGRVTADEPATRLRPTQTTLPLAGTIGCSLLGALLLAGALTGRVGKTGAFFGAGISLLASCLFLMTYRVRRQTRMLLEGHGWWSVSRLGFRNVAYRPGRSVLSVAVVASATFILISVDAFRRDPGATVFDRRSGTGGYTLLVELLLPVVHDPNGPDGRQLLGLPEPGGTSVTPFRVLPGDDTSCLNLYEPRHPKILGARSEFIADGRFTFQSSLAGSDEERRNPWLLLQRGEQDGTVPVIADANSMTYVLHRKLGDEIVIPHGDGHLRLRLVAALSDSIFQSDLVMSESNFLKAFPEQEGYSFLLVDAPPAEQESVAAALETRLRDLGADAVPAAQRLAEFHKVENTYLSTFQTLGGLGLLLGTIGLATVVLRNVLERRRELALITALGYRPAHLLVIVVAENVLLLLWGLVSGAACALVAIAPAAMDRGGRLPSSAGGWLLVFAVFATGLVASLVATRAAVNTRLLEALRTE